MRIRDELAPHDGAPGLRPILLHFQFRALRSESLRRLQQWARVLEMLKSKFEQEAVCSSGFEPASCEFRAEWRAHLQLRPPQTERAA